MSMSKNIDIVSNQNLNNSRNFGSSQQQARNENNVML